MIQWVVARRRIEPSIQEGARNMVELVPVPIFGTLYHYDLLEVVL